MKVNIISKDNFVGLSTDFQIISDLLIDYDVFFTDYNSSNRQKADINIFLELLSPKFIPYAEKNIILPNPEWFLSDWKKYIPYMDMVVCKTIDCYTIFRKYTNNVIYTSFTSFDKYDNEIERKREFLHLAGKSSHKNTNAVLECWQTQLPTLHLIKEHNQITMPNLNHYQRVEDVKQIMNECLFHLCPSEYEGFGHYLNEARSCGAVIITTDAPPMNEMHAAYFVKSFNTYLHQEGLCHKVHSVDLLNAINEVLALSEKQIKEIQKATRQDFLDNDLFFRNQFIDVIKNI